MCTVLAWQSIWIQMKTVSELFVRANRWNEAKRRIPRVIHNFNAQSTEIAINGEICKEGHRARNLMLQAILRGKQDVMLT